MPIFLAQILIGIGTLALGLLLLPKPKQPQPPELDDLQNPTSEAGRPITKVWGAKSVKGINCMHFGDKAIRHRSV